jgi:hypothetical protein
MTTLKITFDDRNWTLTDEASQSSYGHAVLVSDNGDQMTPTEIAIPARPDPDGIFGELSPVTAHTVVCHGDRHHGKDISAENWPAVKALLAGFHNQWLQNRKYSAA